MTRTKLARLVLVLLAPLLACSDRRANETEAETETGDDSVTLASTDATSSPATGTETETETTSETDIPIGPCDPLVFDDPLLDTLVHEELGLDANEPIFADQASTITSLHLTHQGVTSLVGLECLSGLTSLYAGDNLLEDLSPIAALSQLEVLTAYTNDIAELPQLASLGTLRYLDVGDNPQLASIEVLAAAPALEQLDIAGTAVAELTALAGAPLLRSLGAGRTLVVDLWPLLDVPMLEDLNVDGSAIVELTPIPLMPSLIRLRMSDTGHADLSQLAGLPLTQLGAARNGVVDVTPVTTLTPDEMEFVDLSGNLIEDLAPFQTTTWIGGGCGLELLLEDNPVAANPNFEQDWPWMCTLGMWTVWDVDAQGYCGEAPCP